MARRIGGMAVRAVKVLGKEVGMSLCCDAVASLTGIDRRNRRIGGTTSTIAGGLAEIAAIPCVSKIKSLFARVKKMPPMQIINTRMYLTSKGMSPSALDNIFHKFTLPELMEDQYIFADFLQNIGIPEFSEPRFEIESPIEKLKKTMMMPQVQYAEQFETAAAKHF